MAYLGGGGEELSGSSVFEKSLMMGIPSRLIYTGTRGFVCLFVFGYGLYVSAVAPLMSPSLLVSLYVLLASLGIVCDFHPGEAPTMSEVLYRGSGPAWAAGSDLGLLLSSNLSTAPWMTWMGLRGSLTLLVWNPPEVISATSRELRGGPERRL